jgi:predicted MFS family arabinose efflux permease
MPQALGPHETASHETAGRAPAGHAPVPPGNAHRHAPARGLPRWQERALLGVLSAVQFMNIVDFMLVMPLGPQLMRLFAITPAQFGILVSAYSFTAAVFGFVNALYVDRLNRKTVLLVFFALFALATLACGMAPTYGLLLFARAAAGAFGGSLNAITQSIIGDVIPPERRGAATGVVASAFSLASVAGVPLAIVVAANGHWQYPFLALGVLCIPVWLLARRYVPDITGHVLEDPASPLRNLAATLADGNHQRSFAFAMTLVLSGFAVIPYISPYQVANVGITDADLAWIYLVGGGTTFFTSRWIGRLADRHGKQRVFTCVAVLSLAPILITTHFPRASLLVVLPFSTLFFMLVSGRFVPAMAMINGSAAPRLRGSFLSVNSSLQSMAMGAATLISSAFLSRGPQGELQGYGNVGLFSCVLTLVAILLARRLRAVS